MLEKLMVDGDNLAFAKITAPGINIPGNKIGHA